MKSYTMFMDSGDDRALRNNYIYREVEHVVVSIGRFL